MDNKIKIRVRTDTFCFLLFESRGIFMYNFKKSGIKFDKRDTDIYNIDDFKINSLLKSSLMKVAYG